MNFMIRKFDFLRVIMAAVCLFMVPAAFAQQTMPLGSYGQIPAVPGANNAACAGASGTVALTPGQMSTVAVTSQSGALTCTTPTATQLCALFPFVGAQAQNNFHWDWYVVNGGSGTVTLAGGTGVAATTGYTGTLTVAAGSVKHFMLVLTACGASPAASLLSLGTSVF